jgi:RNA polymerase sigma-70 factor (ECF subfamily)
MRFLEPFAEGEAPATRVAAYRTAARLRSRSGPSDSILVLEASAGKRWAMEALFRRYTPLINGVAFRLLGGDPERDDLVQESFAQALSSLHRLQSGETFAAWLSAIVVHTADKLLRRRRLMTRLGLRRAEAIDWERVRSKELAADDVLDLRALYALVLAVPAKLRVPLLLRHVEEASLEEIAALTGVSLATVKRRLDKAHALLGNARDRRDRTAIGRHSSVGRANRSRLTAMPSPHWPRRT